LLITTLALASIASNALDLDHGDLELDLEPLGLLLGEPWCWWVWCFADVMLVPSPSLVPSWPREHCLAMPRWYLLGDS
jgi:hypothetical protein